ncbi:EpsG family protein [Aquimarina sp. 2201CG5-10]|uniref:EpsG family protein n=1 Tax=Aquimarina callyspongiae TaxID=3098150 RepID=UPI002AB47037|nr:EpsG family protein [Aquimarina sp. 2201CG5-10]MDY8136294.1 EpsG family protein [Aquimarina sp. 2201CG5-10]
MIDFVPLEYYYPLYINGALAIVLFTMIHTWILEMNDSRNISYIKAIGLFILVFLIIYIGLRPVSGKYFIDMRTYARHFEHYLYGGDVIVDKDVIFHMFMKFCATFLSVNGFFLLCAFIYIYPMYRVSKVLFKDYWFYSFFMLVISFSFWTYGVNGIRNGMATSLFLMALSYPNKKVMQILFCVLAALFHKTLLLPIGAYILTFFYNAPKTFLIGWLVAIPMSIALGGFWESLFASMGFADDRLGGYLTGGETQGRSGFRYDFLIYSAFAVFAGWYFIFKKQFEDKLYFQIFNVYVMANAFWILVIRANFSNRFAYLSWFLMAVVIVYPFLKQRFFKNQHILLGRVVFLYFAFTYFMYFIYYD